MCEVVSNDGTTKYALYYVFQANWMQFANVSLLINIPFDYVQVCRSWLISSVPI